ncbi:glycosyltransferase [Acidocella sp.]|uniref:glycosyltransferase n=1 Tax=Acidocella sp. TaxID=50710 RepID=UPI0026171457|nr:glycosyltransferase [Acidocella sp.]
MRPVDIDIAMSVYNADKWLPEMLDSIVRQTARSWRLIVWNDGSTDKTAEILQEWQERHPDRMFLIQNKENKNLGIAQGFSEALTCCDAPYVMLADGDDIWLPDKIELSYEFIRSQESRLPPQTPILIHTDLEMVSADKVSIAPSTWQVYRMRPTDNKIRRIMYGNNVSGATMLMNRAVVDIALPIPETLKEQDWWLALAASAFGVIVPLPKVTMLYRRHGNNDNIISNSPSARDRMRRVLTTVYRPSSARRRIYELFGRSYYICNIFYYRYKNQLTPELSQMFSDYINLRSLGFWRRRYVIIRYGLWFRNVLADVGLMLVL